MKPPPLALSLGDPAGIGPEIAVKAWSALKEDGPAFVLVGDADALTSAPGAGQVPVRRVASVAEAARVFSQALPVIDLPLDQIVVAGHPTPAVAAAVIRWIEAAAGLALSGQASGLVTGPIAKAPLYEAGFAFPGHTEFLASLAPPEAEEIGRGPVMLLCGKDLKAALVTIHEPLAKVAGVLSVERILNAGLVTARSMTHDFAIASPRVTVAGFNPHAGEGGTIGDEEQNLIAPAVAALRAAGVDANGPASADSLFHREARARFDVALCMYHDQALIPVKMLDFWGAVNVTLGLPLVRTSPDHGVGFDIAGRGIARPDSLIAAIRLAAEIAERRRRPESQG